MFWNTSATPTGLVQTLSFVLDVNANKVLLVFLNKITWAIQQFSRAQQFSLCTWAFFSFLPQAISFLSRHSGEIWGTNCRLLSHPLVKRWCHNTGMSSFISDKAAFSIHPFLIVLFLWHWCSYWGRGVGSRCPSCWIRFPNSSLGSRGVPRPDGTYRQIPPACSGSPPIWMCLEGFQREVSGLVRRPHCSWCLQHSLFLFLVPIFPSHRGKGPRPRDSSQTGQVSNNKNIKKKKKCSVQNFCLSLLTEWAI